MNFRSLNLALAATLPLFLAACGGGGGGGTANSVSDNTVDPSDNTVQPNMMSFGADIEPIFQAKCTGCHNDGDNPLAPFSLVGEDAASAFKSAIHFSVDGNTMPPTGAPGLTNSERGKILAWATDQPYEASDEIIRVSWIEPLADLSRQTPSPAMEIQESNPAEEESGKCCGKR